MDAKIIQVIASARSRASSSIWRAGGRLVQGARPVRSRHVFIDVVFNSVTSSSAACSVRSFRLGAAELC